MAMAVAVAVLCRLAQALPSASSGVAIVPAAAACSTMGPASMQQHTRRSGGTPMGTAARAPSAKACASRCCATSPCRSWNLDATGSCELLAG